MLNLLKNKKVVWGIVAILVVGLGFGWRLFSATPAASLITGEAKVVSLTITETIEASGSLQAQPFAALSWKTSGVVESVNVKAGDTVKAGDKLINIQPISASANIVAAQADLVNAQIALDDLLHSGTAFAQAAIALKDAQDDYDTAYENRIALNQDKITIIEEFKTPFGKFEKKKKVTPDQETIDNAQSDLDLATALLGDAQREYDRLKDGPNTQDVLAAQAKVDAAQATVNSLYIIAPFDGKVLSIDSRIGDSVSAGELSVNLADINHLYVEAQVDESDVANVKMGQHVEITLDALPGTLLNGKVTVINPVGEVISGLVKYTIRVDVDKVTGQTFIPLGSTANIIIHIKDEATSLAAPITTIHNDAKGEFVMVVQSDGSSKRVDIVSGVIVGDKVTVTGDLKEGDRLLLNDGSSFEAPNPFGGGE
jgi:HlyD family secretion protein